MNEVSSFAKYLAGLTDPDARDRAIRQAKMQAVSEAPEEAFRAPIRSMEDYLASEIEIPPVLVHPFMAVRGGLNMTVGRAGKGKEQPWYSCILTPDGWVSMGDIKVGDAVTNPAGGVARVIGKFPQGTKPVFKITFDDGAAAEAGAEHLWSVTDHHQVEKLVTTVQLRRGYGVPCPVPADIPTADDRPVDPWVLGFLLGDGGLSQNTVMFSTADSEIVDRVGNLVPTSTVVFCGGYDYRLRGGPILDHVRQLGINTTAHFKRVPHQYLTGTVESRLEVLRGLMDADGHASGQFCSMSRGLVEDVIELTRSLGGKASLHAQRPNGAWRTVVQLPINPFWLPRKADKYRLRATKRYVRSVELVEPAVSYCIMLDSDNHLYITDDYVVTHNTVMNLNRMVRWSAGLPWFDDWKDRDGNHFLAPEGPLKILIVENEGAAAMFHRQIGIMLHSEKHLSAEHRKTAMKNIFVWGEGGYSHLKLDDEKKLSLLRQGIEEWEPDLVFIEPLRSLWSGEENSSTEMTHVLDALIGAAADFNCGVWAAHHEKKGGHGEDDKMSAARGSSALEGAVTIMENFGSIKNDKLREVSWSKSRYDVAPPPIRIDWDHENKWYTHVSSKVIEDEILREMQDNPDEPLTANAVAEALDETVTKVRATLKKMVADKKLVRKQSIPLPNGGTTGERFWIRHEEGGDNVNGGLPV